MKGKYLTNHNRYLSHLAKNSEPIRQEVDTMQRQLGIFDKERKRNWLMLIKDMKCLSRTCCRLIAHIHDMENDCGDQKQNVAI